MGQNYSARPSPQEVGQECRHILAEILQAEAGTDITGEEEIINHPVMRYNTLVTRCRGLGASENKVLQALGMAGAMASNLVARSAMRPWVERVFQHLPDQFLRDTRAGTNPDPGFREDPKASRCFFSQESGRRLA